MISISEQVKFIEKLFGKVQIGKNDFAVKCPFCKHKNSEKLKLAIKIDSHLTHCWVCSYSAFSLLPIIKKFGTQQQFIEYKEKFLIKRSKYDEIVETEQRIQLPSDFKPFFDNKILNDPDTKACLSYLLNRGLSEEYIFLLKFGISNEFGWKRRVIMPSFDEEGMLNYYIGRAIDNYIFPKYNNVKSDKNKIIFNEITLDWNKPLALVEGPLDLSKCIRFNATCLLGNQLSENSLLFNKILENSTPIVIMLDNDLPEKIQQLALLLNNYNIDVYTTDLKGYKDPGEMSINETFEIFQSAKPWNKDEYVNYKLSIITNIHKLL
jgi:transcription elongation factor Elf1